MSRFFVLVVLLTALVATSLSCPPGENCPICGRNAINVNSHVYPLATAPNCQNLTPTPATSAEAARPASTGVHSTQHCHCITGYVFKEGTAGDCVKPEDCPKKV